MLEICKSKVAQDIYGKPNNFLFLILLLKNGKAEKKNDLYIRMMSKITLEPICFGQQVVVTTCHRDQTGFQILGLGQCPMML